MKKSTLLLLLLLLQPCDPNSSILAKENAESQGNQIQKKPVIKGVIKFNALKAEEKLSVIKANAKKLHKMSLVFMSELKRPNMVTTGPVNVIGSTVTPAMPLPTGEMQLGTLPPRTKMLRAMVYEINKIVNEIHDQQQSLKVQLSAHPKLIDDWYTVTSLKRDMVEHYNHLKLLCDEEKPDCKAAGKDILAIYDAAEKIQDPLDQIIAALAAEKATSVKN
jgi:hypothetical protein